MAAYRDKADLIAIGAYQQGTDPLTDAAIAARDPIDAFLRQKPSTSVSTAEEADSMLTQLALLSGVPEPAPAQPAEPAPPQPAAPGTPLHSAIPPLHLAA